MRTTSSLPQVPVRLDTTERSIRYDASWGISLLLHTLVIVLAVWLWNADRVSPPFLIDVALVDGDLSSDAEPPAPAAASREQRKEPRKQSAKNTAERPPVTPPDAHPAVLPRGVLALEQTQADVPEPPQVSPQPSAAPAAPELAPTNPAVAPSDNPRVLSSAEPSPAPEGAAVASAAEEAARVSDDQPTAPMTAAVAPSSPSAPIGRAASRADYGWLAEALWSRVEKGKRYPAQARLNQWEGKVVLRAVIREDGQLVELDITRSSGHVVLDQDAMASIRQVFPLTLPRSLGKTQVALQIPINYQLDR